MAHLPGHCLLILVRADTTQVPIGWDPSKHQCTVPTEAMQGIRLSLVLLPLAVLTSLLCTSSGTSPNQTVAVSPWVLSNNQSCFCHRDLTNSRTQGATALCCPAAVFKGAYPVLFTGHGHHSHIHLAKYMNGAREFVSATDSPVSRCLRRCYLVLGNASHLVLQHGIVRALQSLPRHSIGTNRPGPRPSFFWVSTCTGPACG